MMFWAEKFESSKWSLPIGSNVELPNKDKKELRLWLCLWSKKQTITTSQKTVTNNKHRNNTEIIENVTENLP